MQAAKHKSPQRGLSRAVVQARAVRPRHNAAMPRLLSEPLLDTAWTVVCLCAEWCAACREYRQAFERRAREQRDAAHVWVDIEDDSDWLGDIDVETLPTLLVLHGGRPMFFGPVLPHVDVVDRTLRALKEHGPSGDPVPDEYKDAVALVIEALRVG
jgi:thioredoxin 1